MSVVLFMECLLFGVADRNTDEEKFEGGRAAREGGDAFIPYRNRVLATYSPDMAEITTYGPCENHQNSPY